MFNYQLFNLKNIKANCAVKAESKEDDRADPRPGHIFLAYSHQSYSHQVGICRNDKGREYDTVKFPPCPYIMMISIMMRVVGIFLKKDLGTPPSPPPP